MLPILAWLAVVPQSHARCLFSSPTQDHVRGVAALAKRVRQAWVLLNTGFSETDAAALQVATTEVRPLYCCFLNLLLTTVLLVATTYEYIRSSHLPQQRCVRGGCMLDNVYECVPPLSVAVTFTTQLMHLLCMQRVSLCMHACTHAHAC